MVIYYFIINCIASPLFSKTAFLENLNFFVFHFSSDTTYQILVGFFVNGQTNITLDASIGFSILIICHGLVHIFLICLVTIQTPFTKILFLSLYTFKTSASVHLSASFHAITITLSHFLIFIILY
jgi:hypothetical protein